MKIIYVITGLCTGGAEMMLYKLLSRINRQRFEPAVISLIDRGTLGDHIEAMGIPVHTIGMKPGKPTPASVWRLIYTVRQLKPDLIQGWMYHGNLAAQLSSVLTVNPQAVVWSIRNSLYSLDYEKPGTTTIIKLLKKLSIFPEKIVYNSQTSANQHEKLGYLPNKTLIISNGFDTEIFKPSVKASRRIRTELRLSSESFLIGLFGRNDPLKDHTNFIHAASLLLRMRKHPEVHFILAGNGIDHKNQVLGGLIHNLGISDRIHLLGERQDMPELTAALNIASSSSYSEAFSNVIGEAMACGVPCVVTDVGDSAWIVGNTGRAIVPRDSQALANAWKELIDLGEEARVKLGKAARARIIEHFSIDSVVAQYEALYESVLAR